MLLLFYAFGMTESARIVALVQRTARWADAATVRRLLYATQQHTAAVRTRAEALAALAAILPAHGHSTAAELLAANVLPHLPGGERKCRYLAHCLGLLLTHLFATTTSAAHDRDHLGNRRVDTVGTLLAQQLRSALLRMRGFVAVARPSPCVQIWARHPPSAGWPRRCSVGRRSRRLCASWTRTPGAP